MIRAIVNLLPRMPVFIILAAIYSCTQSFAQERLACVGNSITEGDGNGYVEMLADSLGSPWTVGNFGSSGKTALQGTGSDGDGSYWVSDKFPAVFSFAPTVVTIKFGTNDSKVIFWPAMRDEFVPDYCALIDTFRTIASVHTVYICKPCPAFGTDGGEFQPEVLHNEVIPRIDSIAVLKNCTIIDCHTPLLDKGAYFPDGIHPNEDGAEALASIFFQALSNPTAVQSQSIALPAISVPRYATQLSGMRICVKKFAADESVPALFDMCGRLYR